MITDDYSSITGGKSILIFYTSIVYVLGSLIRQSILKGTGDLGLKNIPHPDNLMKICTALNMAREDQNLVLYFIF